ncbi:MAG: hypothetical protein AAGF84_01745 [Planctomycetota bacterium]
MTQISEQSASRLQVVYHARPGWPTLAWLASVPRAGYEVRVEHGPGVETHEAWFGDAVWDGPFDEGRPDAMASVFGAAGRVDDQGGIDFISSTATVDRLQWFVDPDGRLWVSNSLVALLTRLGATLDAWDARYPKRFESVILGLDRYEREVPTSRGPVHLTYVRNLHWRDGVVQERAKPAITGAFGDYASYRDYLTGTLYRLAANANDPARRRRMTPLGTISSGFDSPAASALAKSAGLEEAFTMTQARGGEDDSGEAIGARLGLKVHRIDRDAWRSRPLSETPFLASDAKGEDVYFASAEHLLTDRLVLTGFAAGPWKRQPTPNLDLRRADQSGLSLTEHRLHVGYVSVPVPTIGAADGEAVFRVLHGAEMDRWTSGRPYDKPFCRRLLVEAGVPDGMFGQANRAASVLFFDRRSFLGDASMLDYRAYLRAMRRRDPLRAAARTAADTGEACGSAVLRAAQAGCAAGHRLTRLALLDRLARSGRIVERARYATAYRYLFPWAVGHVAKRYTGTRL